MEKIVISGKIMSKPITFFLNKSIYFRSYFCNFYIKNYQKKWFRKFLKKKWYSVILKHKYQPIYTSLHGYKAIMNCGFSYPLVVRIHKDFNNALLQLAYEVFTLKSRKINVVDIGAAIGDTVFFLQANLQDKYEKILCIDGDSEFFSYLNENMSKFSNVQCVQALLSDNVQTEKELVHIHAGTASAQGDTYVEAITLDKLLQQYNMHKVDLLKIDTDGFDGKILSGSKETLKAHKPFVIFEWHPILINKTGNSVKEAFEVLGENGYQQFLFFTKYGNFSHFMHEARNKEIEFLTEICLNGKHDYDWHYDVIALPDNSVNIISLAECSYAKNKKRLY